MTQHDGSIRGRTRNDVSSAWILVFADLAALLLAFFVLLFSMSQVKVDAWQALVESLTRRPSPTHQTTVLGPSADFNVRRELQPRAIDLNYLEAVIESKLAKDPVLARGLVQRLEDRLIISLPSDLLFKGANARLSDAAVRTSFRLGSILRTIGNRVYVEGHTDPDPITDRRHYQSNWELSLARAVSLANALKEAGYAAPVAAVGYADSRFYDLPTALPRARRFQLGRRVDVVIGRDSVWERR